MPSTSTTTATTATRRFMNVLLYRWPARTRHCRAISPLGSAVGRPHLALPRNMGRDDAPAFVSAQPGMALSSGAAGVFLHELGVRGAEITAVRRDHGVLQVAREIDVRPGTAKARDRVMAVEVLEQA